ncbi:MmcB family DNA repair protein [Rhodospirillaceae bacterium SYSU D60014]|uniref:MmcB family DNA repair protein n=1 Tax=Virgifigura deserti TaxID=2268457 RepID=UPI000E665E67
MSVQETAPPLCADDTRFAAVRLARGVCRALAERGYSVLTEFPLRTGRRVDVIGVDARGGTVIVEIKTSVADFRSDRKWQDYLEFCDLFYFAVPATFPRDLLPTDCGLIVADDYGAEILRQAPVLAMNGSRRRAQILKIARTASQRLQRLIDPPV